MANEESYSHARAVIKKAGRCPNCRARKAAFMVAGNAFGLSRQPGPVPIFVVGCCYISDDSVHCMVCGHGWSSEGTSSSSYLILFNSPKRYVVLPESFHSFICGSHRMEPHIWNRSFLKSVRAVTLLHEIDYDLLQHGDTIIGRLSPRETAKICAMGCRYFHIIWNKPIDEGWLKDHPDEIVSTSDYQLNEFFVKEIQHDGPVSKYVSLEKFGVTIPL